PVARPRPTRRAACAPGNHSRAVKSAPSAAAAPVSIPITGELDLHTFDPRDLGELIPAYLGACAERGIHEVRIVHGKGTGQLRASVHHLLSQSPLVRSFRSGDEHSGSWGATLVTLRR
ncbi:MAG TPA: Smr/MutS family protein, partial [Opitutaceae bacterium]|nr:Smr/MutS family protein [Opitutaceae bacterium]